MGHFQMIAGIANVVELAMTDKVPKCFKWAILGFRGYAALRNDYNSSKVFKNKENLFITNNILLNSSF